MPIGQLLVRENCAATFSEVDCFPILMPYSSLNLESLIEECANSGLRRTSALRACLKVLLSSDQPLTLQEIGASPDLEVECDPVTVYRLVTRLEERRIVRRIGFHSRAAHYCLRESAHQDYLICRECGAVEVLDIACPVEHLEKQIASESGFRDLDHELEFYGQCLTCQG